MVTRCRSEDRLRAARPGCENSGRAAWGVGVVMGDDEEDLQTWRDMILGIDGEVTMAIQHRRGAEAERAAARLLGGVRTGNRGRAAADVTVGDWAVVEVKARRSLPAWLKHAVAQTEAEAARAVSPKLPIVQLHEFGGRVVDDLVVMRAGEFRAWYGEWRGEGENA